MHSATLKHWTEVWDELVISLAGSFELTTVRNRVQAGLDKLPNDHPGVWSSPDSSPILRSATRIAPT